MRHYQVIYMTNKVIQYHIVMLSVELTSVIRAEMLSSADRGAASDGRQMGFLVCKMILCLDTPCVFRIKQPHTPHLRHIPVVVVGKSPLTLAVSCYNSHW